MKTFSNVKGTQDFYPEDKAIQQQIFARLKSCALRSNFKEIETPAFEYLDLLTEKEGEEIKSQIFTLEKRSKEQLGLRFDLTVPSARLFISRQRELAKPVKWFCMDKMWRYEQPQAGRLREFYQFNCEIYGSDKPVSDAEVLQLAIRSLESFGLVLNKDFVVLVNNRKLLEGFLQSLTGKDDVFDIIHIIDRMDKVPSEIFISNLKKAGVEDTDTLLRFLTLNDVDKVTTVKLNKTAKAGLEQLRNILEIVEGATFAPQIARGLAYYTDCVFEIFDVDRKYRAIAGGGRYNNLISLFGGQVTPATGFAMGYTTLRLLLEDKGMLPSTDERLKAYVISVGESMRKEAWSICQNIRKVASAEIDLMERNIKKQMNQASRSRAEYAVFVGEEELARESVKVKNLDSGKENDILLSEISTFFTK